LLISEDLDEVKAMSDRIMVMFNGEVMGTVNSDDVTIEQLGLMMAGETAEEVLGTTEEAV
jgi:simple sugar transport system ATP-binding protein